MKIEVAKSDLENSLSVVRLASGSGSDLSAHYLFRIKDGAVDILTYDMRLFARAPLICSHEGEEGDAFTVEAWRLDKWVAGVSGGVLKLTLDNSDVNASGPRSKIRFRSLDPSKFPFWDGLVASATSVGTVSPASLSRALGVSSWFVSSDDTSKPELCQVEAVNGVLWATDRRALSSVEMPSLPNLNIRVPGKDVGAVVRFLSDKKTLADVVDIKGAERTLEDGGGSCAVFCRPDGCYIGVSRPTSEFPTLNVDRDTPDEVTLTLDRAEFFSAVSVLSASAPKGHQLVTFKYEAERVLVCMPSEAGGEDEFALNLAIVTGGDKFDSPFTVDYPYIKGICDSFKLDSVAFGVTKRGKGGFTSHRNEDEAEDGGNRYFSVIVWRT